MIPLSIYASLQHYWDHLKPVAKAIQTAQAPILRGVHAPRGREWGVPLPPDRSGAVWLVASYADAQRVAPAPVVLLEHGAGQSYHGEEQARRSGSYAGGEGLERVVLFLCPNESVADRWRATYPETPAVVVGCPKLDRWHAARVERVDGSLRPMANGSPGLAHAQAGGCRPQELGSDPATHRRPKLDRTSAPGITGNTARPVVAVAFHWSNPICPESQWALPHYRSALPGLRDAVAAAGGELVGHGHPRAWRQLRREWARIGVRPVESFAEVLDEAGVLVVDNSSSGPEFASLGRPIVWLSAPWYRRDVDHGGRFWSWTEGQPHVEAPEHLAPTVLEVLADPATGAAGRERMVRSVYAHTDGRAAARAADAITEVCAEWGTRTPPG